jgi:hypothetical protein
VSQNSLDLNDFALKIARKSIQDGRISKRYKRTKTRRINYQYELIWPYIAAAGKKHRLQNNNDIANELKKNDQLGIFERFDKSYITKWTEINEFGERTWSKAVLERVALGGQKGGKGRSKILVSFLYVWLSDQRRKLSANLS